MMEFLTQFVEEAIRRRQRIASAISGRGQIALDIVFIGGLFLGTIGMLVRPWMAATAPWGFLALPAALAGHLLLDARRQAALRRDQDEIRVRKRADRMAVAWSAFCALIGASAFFYAWPEPPPTLEPAGEEEMWVPPKDLTPPKNADGFEVLR
jgi:hypothetical protein